MRDSMDLEIPSNWGEALAPEEIDLLKQRAARYALATEAQATDITDAVVFRRGMAKYALALTALREVRPLRSFCAIPCASSSVPGILHFRGEILSLHDIAAFMEPSIETENPAWVIIVEHMNERIGLAADEILDVESYSSMKIQALPITFGDRAAICDGLLPGGTLLLSAARMFHTEAFFAAF